MIGTSYFPFLGTIYLIILTWKDHTNNMRIDSRQNFFMMGIALSLYSHFNHGLIYALSLVAIVMILYKFMTKYKLIGTADIQSISWIFLGFGIISYYILFWWVLLFSVMTLIYFCLKKFIFKIQTPTPFYSVLLISFIIISLAFGLYIPH